METLFHCPAWIKILTLFGALDVVFLIVMLMTFIVDWHRINYVDSEQQQIDEKDINEIVEVEYLEFLN